MDQLQKIKSDIVSLINRDGRNSISLEILLRDYEKCMGCTLPFRELGRADAIGLLMQMQDVLAIKEEMGEIMVQVHSDKFKHISNLVDGQTKTLYDFDQSPLFVNDVEPINVNTLKANENIDTQSLPKETVIHNQTEAAIQNTEPFKSKEIKSDMMPIKRLGPRSNASTSTSKCTSRVSTCFKPVGSAIKDVPSAIDANLIAKFRQILETYPEGITAPEFYKEYEARFEECFDPQEFGFVSLETVLFSLTEIFRVDGTTSSELTLFDARINPQTKKTSSELWIPSLVLDNLALISQEYPDGLDGHEIINIYAKRFGCDLNLKLLGFENIKHFLMKCSSITVVINGEQCTIFPKKWGIMNSLIDQADPLPILGDDIKVRWSTYFSDDFCGPDAQFKQMDLTNLNLMSIFMSEAYAPNKFWIRMIDKMEDMSYMMSILREFYDNNETKYIIGELLVKENLVCATKWFGDWYRTLITKKIDKEIVEVFFIDYGTVYSVPLKEIRALHKHFLDYPIYAICSSLHGIAPTELIEEYTAESRDFFIRNYIGKLLHVTWYKINLTDPFLQLVLIDPAQEEEESINYTLIKAGHAVIHPSMRSIQINPVIEDQVNYVSNFYEVLPWLYLSGNGYQDLKTADHVLEMCNSAEENAEFNPTDTCCEMHFIGSMFMQNPTYVIHAWKDLSSYESDFEDKAIRCAVKSNEVELNAKSFECICHRDDYLQQLLKLEIGESSTQVLQISQPNENITEEQKEHQFQN